MSSHQASKIKRDALHAQSVFDNSYSYKDGRQALSLP